MIAILNLQAFVLCMKSILFTTQGLLDAKDKPNYQNYCYILCEVGVDPCRLFGNEIFYSHHYHEI